MCDDQHCRSDDMYVCMTICHVKQHLRLQEAALLVLPGCRKTSLDPQHNPCL